MKQILTLLFLCIAGIFDASAQNDTMGMPHKGFFYFDFGITGNYFNVNGLNSQLIAGDKEDIFETVPLGAQFGIGLNGKHFFSGIEYGRGSGGSFSVPYQNSSILTFSHLTYHYGYIFDKEKRVSFSVQLGIGLTNFTLNEYSNSNSISFDSLAKQSGSGKAVNSSINLFSNYNFYLEPKVGVQFNSKVQFFRHYSQSVGIYASYQYYTSPVNWFTTGGQFITNMPLNITGVPTLSIIFKFQRI